MSSTRTRRERALRRSLRSSLPFLVVGVLLLVLAIPAVFDLRRLFLGLGLLAIGLGVVSALFNAFDDRPHAGARSAGRQG
jgi:hypothetical protein